jgi:hypothetical protein
VAEEIVEVGPEGMAVRDLAYALAVNEAEVIKALFMKGVAVSVTQTLALELVEMVCEDYETEVLRVEVRATPASALAPGGHPTPPIAHLCVSWSALAGDGCIGRGEEDG